LVLVFFDACRAVLGIGRARTAEQDDTGNQCRAQST
jgi:hypothetical protein